MGTVTHAFNCAIADVPADAAAGKILPSHWNAALTLSGIAQTDTINTFALTQTFTVAPVFTDASGTRTALGATTIGGNLLTLANPGAVTFLRVNADNSVTARSAANFRSDIGAGVGDATLAGTNTWSAQQTFAACTNAIASFLMQAGTLMTSAVAGAWEFAGGVFYATVANGARGVVPTVQFASNGAVVSLSNSSTSAQNVFPGANDVLTLAANTTYMVEADLLVTTGATSHTTTWSLGGTATFTSINIFQTAAVGTSLSAASADQTSVFTTAAGNAIGGATSTVIKTRWKGIIRTNAAGTIIPQVTFSAGPTGTCQIEPNAYFLVYPLGSDTVAAVGAWT